MRKVLLATLLLLIHGMSLNSAERGSSAPYISGDSFRAFCQFTFDELDRKINVDQIKNGDLIFLKTDYLKEFFTKIHPRIRTKYILLTHNSDYGSPGAFAKYLDDDKLIAWFGQNIEISHPKLHPIPIGIANKCWDHGNIEVIRTQQEVGKGLSKDTLLYMNFEKNTYLFERQYVLNLFKDKPYCKVSPVKAYKNYLLDLARAKFVLSPRGNGLDCHRTWESLLMGAIPIVKKSNLDSMYEGLPVLIVEDWNEINEEFLVNKYEEITSKIHNLEKNYIYYWFDLICSHRGNK